MTTIEEQLWDYIDGKGTAAFKSEIEFKIAHDEQYGSVFQDLMNIHEQLGAISLDEPSMSFNRNLMELVQQEIAPVSLKTKVNRRIIYGIGGFFILLLFALLITALLQVKFAVPSFTAPQINPAINLSTYLSPTFIKIFIGIDILIGFLYLDVLLRRSLTK